MKSHLLLPTLFYPYFDRQIWKYCYMLCDGSWELAHRVSLHMCIKMMGHCKRFGYRFKAAPVVLVIPYSNWHGSCYISPLLLNLFSNTVTDRSTEK